MKIQTLSAFVTLCALFASVACADEPPAAKKTAPTGHAQTIQSSSAEVAAGQVLATYETDLNRWAVSVNEGQPLNFVTTTHGNLLGVEVATVEAPLRAHLDLKEKQGVIVADVPDNSEAAKAGLKQHDVLVRLNEDIIEGSERFNELIAAQQGEEVKFHIVRKGKPTTVTATLPNTPVYQLVTSFTNQGLWYDVSDNQYRIGVTLAQADDALRSQLRLAQGEGLVVTEVVAESPAAKAGLKQHDVLTQLDAKRLTTVEACDSQIQEIKDRKVMATFVRGGKESSVELSPQLSTTSSARYVPMLGNVNVSPHLQSSNTVLLTDGSVTNPSVLWYAGTGLRGFTFGNTSNAAPPNAQEQIAQIKQQLSAMQQSLAALEAALQTPPASKQAAPEKPQPAESEKK
jgi:membrane-associated protease RseP (regulator of RpoE activity)